MARAVHAHSASSKSSPSSKWAARRSAWRSVTQLAHQPWAPWPSLSVTQQIVPLASSPPCATASPRAIPCAEARFTRHCFRSLCAGGPKICCRPLLGRCPWRMFLTTDTFGIFRVPGTRLVPDWSWVPVLIHFGTSLVPVWWHVGPMFVSVRTDFLENSVHI